MTDHIDESLIAAYLAGGLTADEQTQLEAHAGACPPCAQLLSRHRAADARLLALFDDIRASSNFPQDTANTIQEKLMRATNRSKNLKRWGVGAAAMLLLGTTGALANHLVSKDLLPGDLTAGPTNKAATTPPVNSPAPPPIQHISANPSDFNAQRNLEDKLDRIITPQELTADNQTLEKVLKYIQEQNNFNVIVNWTALKEAGVEKGTPVTINLRDISLRTALNSTLSSVPSSKPLDIATVDGVAHISTKADLEKNGGYVQPSYDVRDLVVPAPTIASAQNGIDGARKDQVTRLINQAKEAYDIQRFDQAQAVLQQAKNIDPNNDLVAFSLAQVDDKLKWQDWQKTHVRRSGEMTTLQVNNYEAVIPYNDLMIYPDNWPELSRKGLRDKSKTDAAGAPVTNQVELVTQDDEKVSAGKAGRININSANSKELAEVAMSAEQHAIQLNQAARANDRLKGQLAEATNATGVDHQKQPILGDLPALQGPFQKTFDEKQRIADSTVRAEVSPRQQFEDQNDALRPQPNSLKEPPIRGEKPFTPSDGQQPGDHPEQPFLAESWNAPSSGRFVMGSGVSSNSGLIAQGPSTGTPPPPTLTPATRPGETGGGSSSTLGDLKIIRRGSITLEVKSFLDASAAVSKAVAAQDGYIASSASNQLPNGKVQGTIVLRVKPDRVDAMIAALRTIGDVKNQQIVAEDVGKEYTDTESELRALSAMETRLLDLIKNGKGEVKDLVIAEQQLGEYRVRIEKLKGQLAFFSNQIGMATLSVDLTEKDIKAAASVVETENINARVESEEVETGYAKIRKAIEDAKGRIVSGQLTTQAQDQVVAQIIADVPPDQVDALTAVVRSAGNVTQFEKTKAQTAAGGEDKTAGAPVERKDTRMVITMSNLAAIPAKETYVLTLAVPNVEAAFKSIQAEVKGLEQAPAGKGATLNRILQADLQGQRPEQMSANLRAEVRATDASATLDKINHMGEIMVSSTSMGPPNATAAKSGLQITLVSIQSVPARQSTAINGIVDKVPDAAAKIQSAIQLLTNPATRLYQAQVNQQDSRNISATLEFDISKIDVLAIEKALADNGIDVVARSNAKASDPNNTLESKVHYSLNISSADMLPPRKSTAVLMETTDVSGELAKVRAAAADVHAQETGLSTTTDGGKSAAHIQFDVPADKARAIADAIDRIHGQKKSNDQSENRQTDTHYAHERIDLTLVTPAALVPTENSLGTSLSKGFFGGLTNLLRAMQFVIMGLVIALPFLLVLWIGMKLFKRKGTLKQAG